MCAEDYIAAACLPCRVQSRLTRIRYIMYVMRCSVFQHELLGSPLFFYTISHTKYTFTLQFIVLRDQCPSSPPDTPPPKACTRRLYTAPSRGIYEPPLQSVPPTTFRLIYRLQLTYSNLSRRELLLTIAYRVDSCDVSLS